MLSTEVARVRCCVLGTIMSIKSFVSTSLNPDVVVQYWGNDFERDIMLEIEINTELFNSDVLPFANIPMFSTMADEEAVSLSTGTTLIVESVTTNPQHENICVKTKLLYDLDPAMKELKTFILDVQLRCGESEEFYTDCLIDLLFGADRGKAEVLKLCRSGRGYVVGELSQLASQAWDLVASSMLTFDTFRNFIFAAFIKVIQYLRKIRAKPNLSENQQNCLSSMQEILLNAASLCNDIDNVARLKQCSVPLTTCACSAQSFLNLLTIAIPCLHPAKHLLELTANILNCSQGKNRKSSQYFQAGQNITHFF